MMTKKKKKHTEPKVLIIKEIHDESFDPRRPSTKREKFYSVLVAVVVVCLFIIGTNRISPPPLPDQSSNSSPVQTAQEPVQQQPIVVIIVPSEPAQVNPLQQTEQATYTVLKRYINNLDFTDSQKARADLMRFRKDLRRIAGTLHAGKDIVKIIRKGLVLGDSRAIEESFAEEVTKTHLNQNKIKILASLL